MNISFSATTLTAIELWLVGCIGFIFLSLIELGLVMQVTKALSNVCCHARHNFCMVFLLCFTISEKLLLAPKSSFYAIAKQGLGRHKLLFIAICSNFFYNIHTSQSNEGTYKQCLPSWHYQPHFLKHFCMENFSIPRGKTSDRPSY